MGNVLDGDDLDQVSEATRVRLIVASRAAHSSTELGLAHWRMTR
ncbi:hypothetical protein [Humibacillus xanthopallidus]|nr:hypothetical protein [Humibacillus xanthopallidus]